MSVLGYIKTAQYHELAIYDNSNQYKKDGIIFAGTPRKHLYDEEKMVLIPDPTGQHSVFYEFRIRDILHVEDLPNPVNEKGEGIRMIKLWVKKGSYILRCEPMIAE